MELSTTRYFWPTYVLASLIPEPYWAFSLRTRSESHGSGLGPSGLGVGLAGGAVGLAAAAGAAGFPSDVGAAGFDAESAVAGAAEVFTGSALFGVDAVGVPASAADAGAEDSGEIGLGSLLSSGTDNASLVELPVVAVCSVQLLVRQSLPSVIPITRQRPTARL